jgi:hypothetical protein
MEYYAKRDNGRFWPALSPIFYDHFCGAFGFTERLRTPPEPDGSLNHAQLAVGEGSVILTSGLGAHSNEFAQPVMVCEAEFGTILAA